MLTRPARFFHTVRFLKPIQIFGRLAARLRRVRPDLRPAPPMRPAQRCWSLPRWRPPSQLAADRLRFLNEERTIVASGDWNRPDWPRLWVYNLHYFDDLDALDAERRADWHRMLIERWIRENPPPSGAGWEPYPLSLRIVNWCRHVWSGGTLTEATHHSLAIQTRALADQIEYHLLGNHLFANAKALTIAGLFFHGPEAERWLARGLKILDTELTEQVLADGGHFELSPMYHNIIAADLVDLLEANRVVPDVMPPSLLARVRKTAAAMIGWSRALTHGDGEPAFFNDCATGVAPPTAFLETAADQFDLPIEGAFKAGVQHLDSSGYVRARVGPADLFMDVGPVGPDYLPGHAHADTLSFELALWAQRLVVNSGVSVYADGPRRAWERGTSAHNTVVIDGADSSEVWSSFRVARRARPRDVRVIEGAGQIEVHAAHDGYLRLPGRVVHSRTWSLREQSLTIDDRLKGRPNSAEAYFHLHPSVAVEAVGPEVFRLANGGGDVAEVSFDGGRAWLEEGQWAPAFGQLEPNRRLRVRIADRRLVSRWTWRVGPGARPQHSR